MRTKKNIQKLRKSNFILLFDGVCNFCDQSVQFVIKRDPKHQFLYASLQSKIGKEFLQTQSKFIQNTDSIILITDTKVYSKSTAAIKIATQLKGYWFLIALFYIVPPFIRDKVYDAIAKRRYQWFGKLNSCRILTADQKDYFLD